MNFKEIFRPDLIDLNVEIKNSNELFEYISKKLLNKGLVFPGYFSALKEREKNFPTGLETKNFNVAIPHANPENVKVPFIYIVRLANPIVMKQMGDGKEIDVKEIFVLGIKDGKKQVDVLSTLMELFTNDNFSKSYLSAVNSKTVYLAIKENFNLSFKNN